MRAFNYFAALILVSVISSCASLTREQTNTWLDSKGGTSNINMTGTWDSGGLATGGWGGGKFIQDGKRFYGTLGMYYVDGIVNGDDVYMAISSGGKVYYTAYLKKSGDDSITGKAAEGVIIDGPESQKAIIYLISLKKTSGNQ